MASGTPAAFPVAYRIPSAYSEARAASGERAACHKDAHKATREAVWFGVRKPGAWLSGYTHRPMYHHQVRCLLVSAALKL
jgi:hypothetical protein